MTTHKHLLNYLLAGSDPEQSVFWAANGESLSLFGGSWGGAFRVVAMSDPPTDLAELEGVAVVNPDYVTDWYEGTTHAREKPRLRPRTGPQYVPINIEKRLAGVDEAVADLSKAVAELRQALSQRPITSYTAIVDFNSDRYSARHPIPVAIEKRGKATIATFAELGVQGNGSTPMEAINDLKERVISLYEALEDEDPAEPSTLSSVGRRVLRYYVGEALVEDLPTVHGVDWMVDNLPVEHLHLMVKELLRYVIRGCRLADVDGVAEFLLDWEATVEEVIADRDRLEDVLLAREETRQGKGIRWEEAKKQLGL